MLNGKWTVVTSLVTVDLILDVKVKGSNISGCITYGNKSVQITNGKIKDGRFSFEAFVKTKRGNIHVAVQGYLVDDTHISGIAKAKIGSLRFTAKKN
jgi:hypothetical protein